MTSTVRQVTSVGDLCADHIGDRVTIRTPHDGVISGVFTGIRWTSQGLHVCLEGAEAWSRWYRCSTFSPCEVA